MSSRSLPLPLPRRARLAGAGLPRPRLRLILAALALAGALGGGWWWLRDSPIASVDEVVVTGLHGSQAASIRSAITTAAQDMTTLHVREELLRTAVARYPIVADIRASGDFPHRLDVTIVEHVPVATLKAAGRSVAVAGDGTLLRGTTASDLPTVTMKTPPAGSRLQDPLARAQVDILSAAPAALRRDVTRTFTGSRGLQLQLRRGPVVAFGAPERLAAKWAALAAVLADPASAGGTLIDLSVPERPSVAGLEPLTPEPTVDTDGDGIPDAVAPGAGTETAPATATTPTPSASTPQPTTPAVPPATP